jgi:hypothetical protein
MLTQRDAMRLIKTTAEAVMESLRMLLIILMNQIEVKAPDQEISDHHASSLQSLLEHVNNQKEKIEELAKALKTVQSPRKSRGNNGPKPSEPGDLSDFSWELEEEELMASMTIPSKRTAPRMTPTNVTLRNQVPQPVQVQTNENQLALTAQAVESWGNKRVSWGKTHNGKRFAEVYEESNSYVDWITARAKNATPAMQDFITYCRAREDMENQAVRNLR